MSVVSNDHFYLPVIELMGSMSSYICSPVTKLEFEFTCYDTSGSQQTRTNRSKLKINECVIKGPYSRSENISFCEIQTSNTVMVTVLVTEGEKQEAYMAIPFSHWGKEYRILGIASFTFAIAFSFTEVKVNWIYDARKKNTTSRSIIIRRNESHTIHACSLSNHSVKDVNYFVSAVSSKGQFGVVAGTCRSGPDSATITIDSIESVMPVENNTPHEFISYCAQEYQCMLVIYSVNGPIMQIRDLLSRTCIEYESSTEKALFTFEGRIFRITSSSYILVMVYFYRHGIECQSIILPSFLWNDEYVWRLLKTNTKHYVVLISDIGRLQYTINYRHLSSYNITEDAEYLVWHVTTVLLSENDDDSEYRISSKNDEVFGCYAYGYAAKRKAYAVPVGLVGYKEADETTIATCVVSEMKLGDQLDNDCDGFVDEEIRNARDDDIDGRVDEDCFAVTKNACLLGLYGTDCSRKCFCENSICKPDGSCQGNVTCVKGYFGDQCQNKDYVAVANVSHTGMQYRSYTKCQKPFTAVNLLTIEFTENLMFKWVRIDAVSRDNLVNISLKFESLPNKSSCYSGECLASRNVYVDNNTLFIYCDIPLYTCRLKILFAEGKQSKRLCSVYVGGGRNMALYMPTSMSSYYDNAKGFVSRGSLAVDGSKKSDVKACATTRSDDVKGTWRIIFPSPVVIHSIVIYFKVLEPGRFNATLYDDRNKTLDYFSSDLKSLHSVITKTNGAVKSIEIYSTKAGVPLSICELLAYGECAPPTYGPDCTDICSITCDDQICSYEGYCRSCPTNTSGPYCFEGCLGWCEEYVDAASNVTLPSLNLTTTHRTHPHHHHHRPRDIFRDLFHIENVWFYPIMLTTLLTVVCCAGVKAPAKETDKKKASEPKLFADHIEKEEERSLENQEVSESVVRSSTSVDLTVIKVKSKVNSTEKYHSSTSSVHPPATQVKSKVHSTEKYHSSTSSVHPPAKPVKSKVHSTEKYHSSTSSVHPTATQDHSQTTTIATSL